MVNIIDPDTEMASSEVIENQYNKDQRDYELESHERSSIKEIEKMLKEEKYRDEATIRDHLEYLEQIAHKLQKVIVTEQNAGFTNISLKNDYNRIIRLCEGLSKKIDNLNN